MARHRGVLPRIWRGDRLVDAFERGAGREALGDVLGGEKRARRCDGRAFVEADPGARNRVGGRRERDGGRRPVRRHDARVAAAADEGGTDSEQDPPPLHELRTPLRPILSYAPVHLQALAHLAPC